MAVSKYTKPLIKIHKCVCLCVCVCVCVWMVYYFLLLCGLKHTP